MIQKRRDVEIFLELYWLSEEGIKKGRDHFAVYFVCISGGIYFRGAYRGVICDFLTSR